MKKSDILSHPNDHCGTTAVRFFSTMTLVCGNGPLPFSVERLGGGVMIASSSYDFLCRFKLGVCFSSFETSLFEM